MVDWIKCPVRGVINNILYEFSNMAWAVSCKRTGAHIDQQIYNENDYKNVNTKKSTHPQSVEVMYDGNVHHGAERPTHIRPVHGVVE